MYRTASLKIADDRLKHVVFQIEVDCVSFLFEIKCDYIAFLFIQYIPMLITHYYCVQIYDLKSLSLLYYVKNFTNGPKLLIDSSMSRAYAGSYLTGVFLLIFSLGHPSF